MKSLDHVTTRININKTNGAVWLGTLTNAANVRLPPIRSGTQLLFFIIIIRVIIALGSTDPVWIVTGLVLLLLKMNLI